MLEELQKKFHSVIKSLEVLYVIENAKPCARILVNEDQLDSIKFLEGKGLKVRISDFKVIKQSLQSSSYSDFSLKIPVSDKRKGNFITYISRKKELCENCKNFEHDDNHLELGLTLGYPRCCCEFFEENYSNDNTDLTLNTLFNSEGIKFEFWTNIAARHFDISLLSHFPHSFECRESINLAKHNFSIIKQHSAQFSELIAKTLQGAVVYSMNGGIFLLKKCELIDKELIYSDVIETEKSKLYYLLSSNKKVTIRSKNEFEVNNDCIKGKNIGIMLFT